MIKDPFTPEQKSKMKCSSDQAIFYKAAIMSIFHNFRNNKTFEFDLEEFNFRPCMDPVRIVWSYYQDADGNMHRIQNFLKK